MANGKPTYPKPITAIFKSFIDIPKLERKINIFIVQMQKERKRNAKIQKINLTINKQFVY